MDIEERARQRDREDQRRQSVVVTAHLTGARFIEDRFDGEVEELNMLTAQVAARLFHKALDMPDINQPLPIARGAYEVVMRIVDDGCADDPKPVRDWILGEIARHFLAGALSGIGAALSRYDAEHPPEAD